MKDTTKDIMKNNKDIVLNGILVAVALNLGAIVLRLVWVTIPGVPMLGSTQAMIVVAIIAIISLAVTRNKYMSYNLVVIITSVVTAWLMHLAVN